MKALITAGGRGTRLRPLTFTQNKHLIPIANKPMLLYAIESIREAGIREIGINYNTDSSLEELKLSFGDGKELGVNITYIYQPSQVGGIADVVRVAESFLKDDKFIFYLGDNMLATSIKELVTEFENDNYYDGMVLLSEVPDPQRFGSPVFNSKGEIVKFIEKPAHPSNNFAITGIYFFTPVVFKCFKGKDAIKPSARGELEIPDAYQYMIEHGYKVKSKNVTGWWKDTGKLNDLILANRLILEKHYKFNSSPISNKEFSSNNILEGDISINKSCIIKNSHIRGPVVIDSDTEILNSYIGPFTSIGKKCKIDSSEVENSIMLNNSEIISIQSRIDSSLIGKNVMIKKNSNIPRVLNLMIGDNSEIYF